jgi:hypothetical protein
MVRDLSAQPPNKSYADRHGYYAVLWTNWIYTWQWQISNNKTKIKVRLYLMCESSTFIMLCSCLISLAFECCSAACCRIAFIAVYRETHIPSYPLGYCWWVCYLVWTNSANIGGAVLRFVMGDFTCFDRALSWISIGLRTAFFGGIIFNRVN